MDPFQQVSVDAEDRLQTLRSIVKEVHYGRGANPYGLSYVDELKQDFRNNLMELQGIFQDMKSAIATSATNPEDFGLDEEEVEDRRESIQKMETDMNNVIAAFNRKLHENPPQRYTDNPMESEDDDVSEENAYRVYNDYEQTEALREQDNQLAHVFTTVENLRTQAIMMSGELDDQAILVDDFDVDIERVQGKLDRGMGRVKTIIKENEESFSTCCISFLVLCLISLLVLLLIL